MSFIQSGPQIDYNHFDADQLVTNTLDWLITDSQVKEVVFQDLARFYSEVLPQSAQWSDAAEKNPPQHIPYSPWGERIDEIKTHEGWSKLDGLSGDERLINLGYHSAHDFGRIHQFLKLFLFHPDSAFYTCPLAMTDGAAKLINQLKKMGHLDEYKTSLLDEAFKHITASSAKDFWTSGQWMTEKPGGSDVSQTETIAKKVGDHYELYGTKWFTSATTSQITFTLARIVDEKGEAREGNKGLSLFFVKLRDDHGKLQGIRVRRLKDKLGTKALPTAELDFEGAEAHLVGQEGQGVKNISHLFNVTRIYNACTTIGSFKRLLDLANDYAEKRVAFKRKLSDHPLHKRTLNEVSLEFEKCFKLTFYTISLLQEEENNERKGIEDHQVSAMLRLLTPITKLYTAKKNIIATTELVESFGGAGYIEDTGIPRFLRDSQVFCIWEGTTNILSLDCLRAIEKENAFDAFVARAQGALKAMEDEDQEKVSELSARLEKLTKQMLAWSKDSELIQYHARDLAFRIGDLTVDIFCKPTSCDL